jgi:hypothetical protein
VYNYPSYPDEKSFLILLLKILDVYPTAGGLEVQGWASTVDWTFGFVAFGFASHGDWEIASHSATTGVGLDGSSNVAEFHWSA